MFFLALETEEWDDPGYPSYPSQSGQGEKVPVSEKLAHTVQGKAQTLPSAAKMHKFQPKSVDTQKTLFEKEDHTPGTPVRETAKRKTKQASLCVNQNQ